MGRAVICISRETGAGGAEVGRLVADRLGFLYDDEEIVARAAEQADVDPATIAGEERRRTLAHRVIELIVAGGVELPALAGAAPPFVPSQPAGDEIRAFIREAIEQTAARGDVVIVAHAASFALEPSTRNLRVLVVGGPEARARRLGEREGLDTAEAERSVREGDAGRRDYLKRFYGVDRELPSHYDLVVNTDLLGVDQAAGVISHAAGL